MVRPRLECELAASDDLAEAERYAGALGTELTFAFHYLASCSSTQEVAASLAEAGAQEGTVVLAEEQVAGRGRLGRSWVSPRGGLWFTVVLRPERLKVVQLLSLAAGVAVARAVRDFCGVDARLKWPNDVQVEGRKLAGILVEGAAEAGAPRYALLGVGLNVNNDLPPELREAATSLKEIVGRAVPRVPLLLSMLEQLDEAYSSLRRGEGGRIVEEWKALSSTLGARVRAITRGEVIEGVAVDVDSDGGLVVETGSVRRVCYSGEVIHLR